MKPTLTRFFPKLLFVMMMLAFTGISRNGNGLHAQIQIGFSSNGLIGMPDTVFSGDSMLVGAYIKNYDTSGFYTFNDTIQINGHIDTLGPAVIPFSLPPVPPQIPIQPGDSLFYILPMAFRDSHMGGNFRIGNNVIVVWPISFDPTFSTFDSITVNVFLIDTISSIGDELAFQNNIRCYPVPASGPLFVTSSSQHLVIKEIIIRDASGKTVAISNNPSTGIMTDAWSSGIYMLEIYFENGQRSIYKIVR